MSQINRKTYLSRNLGVFSAIININGLEYKKVEDLRYGTNPHQPAAFYKPCGCSCVIGDMKILKSGKSGLSQTNLEDISYSLNILKYFSSSACVAMKHVNPCGAAVRYNERESLCNIYRKARDCDARAAFGSVVAFNKKVDAETASEIMTTFVECVVAPDFEDEALKIFNDTEKFKLNKHIRIIRTGDPALLPKFIDDNASSMRTIKVLADGSLVISEPLLTGLKSVADIKKAEGENKKAGRQISEPDATGTQLADLLTAWYININVRSNGVVIVKNGQTLSVGTGEQDRVGAVEQAIEKYKLKYKGENTIEGAAMASDGFFPFPDAVEVAAAAGVKAIIAPAGSLRDADVIKRANELNVALYHAPERIFSHH